MLFWILIPCISALFFLNSLTSTSHQNEPYLLFGHDSSWYSILCNFVTLCYKFNSLILCGRESFVLPSAILVLLITFLVITDNYLFVRVLLVVNVITLVQHPYHS